MKRNNDIAQVSFLAYEATCTRYERMIDKVFIVCIAEAIMTFLLLVVGKTNVLRT